MHEVYCIYLNKKAVGLDVQPYPGELGAKVYSNISKEAWQLWIKQQTMLINEHKLSMLDVESREFLRSEMVKFFALA